FGASWDMWRHNHANPLELYGADGTMLVPDPNFFSGAISISKRSGDYTVKDTAAEPFGAANWPPEKRIRANYRMLGVAELVAAAAEGREPRCSGRLAAHVVEVMEAILVSAAEGRFVSIQSSVERPAPLLADEAKRLMRRVLA